MIRPVTHGQIFARFAAGTGCTKIQDLFEAGGLRLKFPHASLGAAGGFAQSCEAVLVNTGGGIVGGDLIDLKLALDAGARLTFTTASAERIYRAMAAPARLNVHLDVAAGAALEWLPQENILYSGAALRRRIEISLMPTSTLTFCETTVFGRTAMGESVTAGAIDDHWRLRLAGRTHFYEALKMGGDIQSLLDRPAAGRGAKALTVFLHMGPGAEAEAAAAAAQDYFSGQHFPDAGYEAGVSAFRGMLLVRAIAADAAVLRRSFAGFLEKFRRQNLPRVFAA